MTDSAIGRIVCCGDVRRGVESNVRKWADSYVYEVARQYGVELEPFRAYGSIGVDSSNTDLMPAAVIVAPGTSGPPQRRGNGDIDAVWAVGVGVLVADKDREVAVYKAELYGAAIRTLILQNPSIGDFTSSMRWTDEETTVVAWDTGQVVASCALTFDVVVNSVTNDSYGLAAPIVHKEDETPAVYVQEINIEYER